jgi:hypothetical protein
VKGVNSGEWIDERQSEAHFQQAKRHRERAGSRLGNKQEGLTSPESHQPRIFGHSLDVVPELTESYRCPIPPDCNLVWIHAAGSFEFG